MATVVLNIAIQSQNQPSQAQTLVFVQDLISLDKTAFIESKALILVELMRQSPVICACKSARTQFKPQKKVSAALGCCIAGPVMSIRSGESCSPGMVGLVGPISQLRLESRLPVVRFADPGNLHPGSTALHPDLALRAAQFAALAQHAGAQRIRRRIFHRAGVKRTATVFTEGKNALRATGGGLDKGSRHAFHETKAGRGGRYIGPEGRA